MMRGWLRRALLLAVAGALWIGCDSSGTKAQQLAAIEVTASRTDLLFVWVDERGETLVETQASAVPEAQREHVRVIDPQQPAANDQVLLADLRQAAEGGKFPTRVAPRSEFDALVQARRSGGQTAPVDAANGPASAAQAAGAAAAAGGLAAAGAAQGRAPVIIYGAEWCGACTQAAGHLRRRGVPFVEKDIEHDKQARREMDAKLQASGQRSGSIPVLDVRGRILLGFSSSALDSALGRGI